MRLLINDSTNTIRTKPASINSNNQNSSKWFSKDNNKEAIYNALNIDNKYDMHHLIIEELIKFSSCDLPLLKTYKDLYFWLNECILKADSTHELDLINIAEIEISKFSDSQLRVSLTCTNRYEFTIPSNQFNLVLYFYTLLFIIQNKQSFRKNKINTPPLKTSLTNIYAFLVKYSNPHKTLCQGLFTKFIVNNESQENKISQHISNYSKFINKSFMNNNIIILIFGFSAEMKIAVDLLKYFYRSETLLFTTIDSLNEEIGINLNFGDDIHSFEKTFNKILNNAPITAKIDEPSLTSLSANKKLELVNKWQNFLNFNYDNLLKVKIFLDATPYKTNKIQNFITKNIYNIVYTHDDIVMVSSKFEKLIENIKQTRNGIFSTQNVLPYIIENVNGKDKIDNLFRHVITNHVFRVISKLGIDFALKHNLSVIFIKDEYKTYANNINNLASFEKNPLYYPITLSEFNRAYKTYCQTKNLYLSVYYCKKITPYLSSI